MWFQRAISAVVGFNGQLALGAIWHGLPPKRLEALRVLHNVWLRRADGTTAAERLLGTPSHDLLAYLLEHVELPPPGSPAVAAPAGLPGAQPLTAEKIRAQHQAAPRSAPWAIVGPR